MNLDSPGSCTALAARIKEDIDAYCVQTYDDGFRAHLGASVIGHACSRYCWNTFRWIYYKQPTGRMLRLFNRGKREEDRFIEWLRGIGFQIYDVDDNGDQFRISFMQGHGGGSTDGIGRCPESYQIDEPLLTEFKTSGTGRKFEELKGRGVALAKPQHFAQMCVYGRYYNLKHALYMSINKNDDDLYVEIVKLDFKVADQMILKAADIIKSQTPPPKLSENTTYWECKYCDFWGICHNNFVATKNCRSCSMSEPVENANWKCKLFNSVIPVEFIKQSCDNWEGII